MQQQWGTVGQAITKSVSMIEEVVKALQDRAASQDVVPAQDILELASDLAGEAVRPLSHILRLSASRFNSFQAKRKDKLQATLARSDFALSQAVRDTPLATRAFFTEDLTDQIKEASSRKAQKDILRAVQGNAPRRQGPYDRPASSSVPSFRRTHSPSKPAARGRGHQGRQPFRPGRPGQGSQGRQQSFPPSAGSGRGRGAKKD